jgi:Ran GTPase-activating protein (RanGAP) involved in mRNA processing and transport
MNSLFLKTKRDFEKAQEYVFVIKEANNFDTLNKVCEDFNQYYLGKKDYSLKVLDKEIIPCIIENKELIPNLINKLILRGLNLTEEECCGVIRSINDKICKFDLGGNQIVTCVEITELLKDEKMMIHDLILFNNKLVNDSFDTLSEGVYENNTLISLDVSNNENANNIASLIESVKDKPLTNLNLSIIPFAAEYLGPSLSSLYDFVKTNKSVVSLDLSHTGLNDNGLTLLFKSLMDNNVLKKLKVNHNNITLNVTNEGLEIIKNSLEINKSLKTLDISNNKISEFKNLGDCIQENRSIEHFIMNFVVMTDKFSGLGTGFINNNVIVCLELGFCGLNDEDAKTLASILRTCPRLKKLCLRKNYLFSEAARLLSIELEHNTSLTHLEISWNNVKDEGVNHLEKALIVNYTLEYLDIRSNYISEKGCEKVFKILNINKNLKKIDLSFNNNISDEFYLTNIIDFKRIRFFHIKS